MKDTYCDIIVTSIKNIFIMIVEIQFLFVYILNEIQMNINNAR